MFNKIKLFILVATIFCTTSITAFASDCADGHDSFNKIYKDMIASDVYKKQVAPLNFKYVYAVHRHISNGHRTIFVFCNEYSVNDGSIIPVGKTAIWGTDWYDGYHDFSKFRDFEIKDYHNVSESCSSVVFSTTDLKDQNGNIFFSAPITQLIQTNLRQMIVTMVSSTKSLTILGISLLALLSGSLLLPRVLRKFL